ncbi:hypothetical protein RQN30_04745 [Arcanobacterium hippocoleae]
MSIAAQTNPVQNTASLVLHPTLKLTLITIRETSRHRNNLAHSVFGVPDDAAGLLCYALEHRPLLLREVSRAAFLEWGSELCKLAETSHIANLLFSLQKAGWPALGVQNGSAILVFAELRGKMPENLTAAGFTVQPIQIAPPIR